MWAFNSSALRMLVPMNRLFGGTDKEVCHRGTSYVLKNLMKNKKEVSSQSLMGL